VIAITIVLTVIVGLYLIMERVRKILSHILKNSDTILFLYNLVYKIKNKRVFYSEINRRLELSIFDYKELYQPIPYYPAEKVHDTNYYGYSKEIKKYAGIENESMNSLLEHGLFLGNRILAAEGCKTTRSVITMSQNRVETFKQHGVNKPIIAIGPYIHYAEPLLNEKEFNVLKKELGRVLLVMPAHTARGYVVEYSDQVLFDFIDKIRMDYDTIMVCLHFRDLLNNPNCASVYEEKGYRVVCAGYITDTSFVRRLKSIIMLSDYVISNTHGSNTGYCLYLGKPQTIVKDESFVKKGYTYYTDDEKKERDYQVKEIEDAFSSYSLEITSRQREVVDKYWGLSLIKSPKELREEIRKINK
jgi:hypothetical protein